MLVMLMKLLIRALPGLLMTALAAIATIPGRCQSPSVCASDMAPQVDRPQGQLIAPLADPSWYDWIYASYVPNAARDALLPRYQKLDYLQKIRIPVALIQSQDNFWSLLSAMGSAMGSNAQMLVRRSATGVGTWEKPAGTVQSPENTGWDIGSEIRTLEGEIKQIRHQYGLDSTIGPASKPFDISSVFNDDGLKAWLGKTECGRKLLQQATTNPRTRTPGAASQNIGNAQSRRAQLLAELQAAADAATACSKNQQSCFQGCSSSPAAQACVSACDQMCNSAHAAFDAAMKRWVDCHCLYLEPAAAVPER